MSKKPIFFYLISFVFILFDQATKLAVKGFNIFGFEHKGMYYGEVIPVLGTFLQWTYIENFGMAFGIKVGFAKIFLSIISLLVPAYLCYLIQKIYDKVSFGLLLGLSLIIAGAFGNGIDRNFYGVLYGTDPLFYGGVVDFIMVDIPDIDIFGLAYSHFPIFNIADSCVTIGVVLLMIFHKQFHIFESNSGEAAVGN